MAEERGRDEYRLEYSGINDSSVVYTGNMADATRCLNAILSKGNRVGDILYGVNIYQYIMETGSVIPEIKTRIESHIAKYIPNARLNGVELKLYTLKDAPSPNYNKAVIIGISIKDSNSSDGYRNITFVIAPDKYGNISGRIVDL